MRCAAALCYRAGPMSQTVHFETPENIQVAYRIAGPGTRYLAFIIDAILIVVGILVLALFIGGLFLAIQPLGNIAQETLGVIAIVTMFVVTGFALIGYFALFELFMSGQTPGKRLLRVRVVNAQGFSLGFGQLVLRNLFRLIDVIPLLWVVPLLSAKVQRFGDMVAGTLVVSEDTPHLSPVRERYAAKDPADRRFVFTPPQVAALRPVDIDAVELFLERRDLLHPEHRHSVSEKIARGVARRLSAEEPAPMERDRFLEDLFTAYLAWENRRIA